MSEITLNDLIGIPYKLNHHNMNASDCFGITSMFYKYILHDDSIPVNDGKKIFRFRNRKNDFKRLLSELVKQGFSAVKESYVKIGDIFILIINKEICIGVAIDTNNILITSIKQKSHVRKISSLKNMIYKSYRRYE